jgi:hypothetical protein
MGEVYGSGREALGFSARVANGCSTSPRARLECPLPRFCSSNDWASGQGATKAPRNSC